MPRRKQTIMSDGSDSDASASEGSDGAYNSQEDEDSKAERRLFEHNGRKRQRTGGGKAGAWEGIFGEDEDDGRPSGKRAGKANGRTDWTKAPAFVNPNNDIAKEKTPEVVEVGTDDSEESEDDSDAPASPRMKEDDYDEPGDELAEPSIGARGSVGSGRGGIGSGRGGLGSPRGGIGSVRGGIGSSKPSISRNQTDTLHGGIGSSSQPPQPIAEHTAPLDQSIETREQRAFRGAPKPAAAAVKAQLTATDAAHFRNIESSFGARMLANLGWKAGEGLGKEKDGRAVPVAAGKVMKGQGIRSGVRTEDSKREARRKGEIVSDDEDEKPKRGQASKPARSKEEQKWRNQKKVKVKVEHKTYEQVIAEAGSSTGIGLVLDARGGDLKEVQSMSDLSLSAWTPTSDKTQLPELRHNLRLIVDVSRGDVDGLAREGRSVNERRKWALREEELARKKVEETSSRISRLEGVQAIISQVSTISAEQASQAKPSLDPLAPHFDSLLSDPEYVGLGLDEIVVGSIAQVLRRAFSEWSPFDFSDDLLCTLKTWRKAYNLPKEDAVALNGDSALASNPDRQMTAWESLLWTLWVPKVRSTINNEWNPAFPDGAVTLLESWAPILPNFIRDNILDQLVLPKVKSAVDDWSGRSSSKMQSLAAVVFPWLPLLGARVEEILEGAKRRIRRVLQKWMVKDRVPKDLDRWKKDIYSAKEWDKLMLDWVVPKLGATLRDDFTINPRKQDLEPLKDWVLPWRHLIRASTFSRLLEEHFFTKWLDILYIWLIQPSYRADEVATWFTWWKGQFPADILQTKGIAYGFNKGLELMDEAMQLGADASTRLRKPTFVPLQTSRSKSIPARRPVDTAVEITFRSIAEEYASRHDLIFLPIGKSHSQTGKPLFKVSKNVDGRGGLVMYIGEDAVFAQVDDGSFKAVSLDDMVQRASA